MNFKTLISLIIILFSCYNVYATEDNIIGIWLTQNKDSKIEIVKNNDGTFSGKIIWLKKPYEADGKPKLDDENPEEQLRNRKILGLEILRDFKYDQDEEEWNSGTIYDPNSGSIYKCYMWFDDNDSILHVKGYIGFSLIGRKVCWTRVQ